MDFANGCIEPVGLVITEPAFVIKRVRESFYLQLLRTDQCLVGDCVRPGSGIIGKIPLNERIPAGSCFSHSDRVSIFVAKPDSCIRSDTA